MKIVRVAVAATVGLLGVAIASPASAQTKLIDSFDQVNQVVSTSAGGGSTASTTTWRTTGTGAVVAPVWGNDRRLVTQRFQGTGTTRAEVAGPLVGGVVPPGTFTFQTGTTTSGTTGPTKGRAWVEYTNSPFDITKGGLWNAFRVVGQANKTGALVRVRVFSSSTAYSEAEAVLGPSLGMQDLILFHDMFKQVTVANGNVRNWGTNVNVPLDERGGAGAASAANLTAINKIRLYVESRSGNAETFSLDSFSMDAVPEPASVALLAPGLLGLLLSRRKRK